MTLWENNADAALTLAFDDGYKETCVNSIDILLAYGFTATHYLVTGKVANTFEGKPIAGWADWQKAHELGFEIASHGVTHHQVGVSFINLFRKAAISLARMETRAEYLKRAKAALRVWRGQKIFAKDDEVLKQELVESRRMIEENMGAPVLSFAYPGGWHNQWAEKMVKSQGYSSARGTDEGYNLPQRVNLYAMKCQMWDKFTTVEEANKWVDKAIEKHAWLIECHHLLGEHNPTDYPYFTKLAYLREHLDYISQKKVWVDTQQNIAKYILEKSYIS